MESSHIALPSTDLHVHPLCLGSNVMGYSSTAEESFAVLDAYAKHGGNFIDTADMYSEWKPGNVGHESETIIGQWMKDRGNRADMVIDQGIQTFHSPRTFCFKYQSCGR